MLAWACQQALEVLPGHANMPLKFCRSTIVFDDASYHMFGNAVFPKYIL